MNSPSSAGRVGSGFRENQGPPAGKSQSPHGIQEKPYRLSFSMAFVLYAPESRKASMSCSPEPTDLMYEEKSLKKAKRGGGDKLPPGRRGFSWFRRGAGISPQLLSPSLLDKGTPGIFFLTPLSLSRIFPLTPKRILIQRFEVCTAVFLIGGRRPAGRRIKYSTEEEGDEMLPRTTSWLRVALLATALVVLTAIAAQAGTAVHFYGHVAFRIETPSGGVFLFDPGSPPPPTRRRTPSPSWARWTTSS